MTIQIRWGSAAALVVASGVTAQVPPVEQFEVGIGLDSGMLVNRTNERAVLYETLVHIPSAGWIRLTFDEAVLGAAPGGDSSPTILRLTAVQDGGVQTHTALTLEQWQYTSAYFNGGAVLVELEADPGAAPSRVRASVASVGPLAPGGADTICDSIDDRELSDDPRSGRLMPIACSAWLINDPGKCFLTAGHCSGGGSVMQFNVPLSSGSGGLLSPGPEDQYAIDPVSMQSNGGGGTGNDWAYFGCFPNTETGLTPAQAQGDTYILAMPPSVSGQNIRITGYGTTGGGVPPQWNQAQKTHTGPYSAFTGTRVSYRTDTTGGNSGSPVIDDSTGFAIGIHTHGGCSSGGGGQNNGTGMNHPDLQAALANPQGVCIPTDLLEFTYPDGLPELIAPQGQVIRVEVAGLDGGIPIPGSGTLHYDAGGGEVTMSMTEVEPNVYDAEFPDLSCGGTVNYWFSAMTKRGFETTDPSNGQYGGLIAVSTSEIVADDFESDTGWSVESFDLIDGPWQRGVPEGGGDSGDPASDFDGSGSCYVTGIEDGNHDVDGGPTVLTSPVFDLSGSSNPYFVYARWFTVSTQDEDRLKVSVSDDGGDSWEVVESVGHDTGWQSASFRVLDFVDTTSTVMIRFAAVDNPNDSITEAGVDDLRIVEVNCSTVAADLDGDGDVDFTDLLILLASWGPCPGCIADFDGDGDVGFTDLLTLLVEWTQ